MTAPTRADHVVICVFDGLRPDMLTPELTPNLSRFARQGRWFREARSVFPSMTRVATTSIATGAPPAVHGIVGNAFLFPQAAVGHVLDTSRAADIALAESATGGRFVTAETFGDRLAAEGRRLAVVHTGSAGSAHLINPRARANGHWTFSILGRDHTPTPEAVEEVTARFGPPPARALPRFDEITYATEVFVGHVLGTMRPDAALIWFNEPDTSYHYKFLGAPETLAVLGHVDAAFGRILDWIDSRPDAERWAVIAASDHGQISSRGEVPIVERLREAGHPAFAASARTLAGAAISVTGGNMGEIRVLDGDAGRRDRIAAWLAEQSFTGMIFSPARNEVEGQAPGSFALSLVGLDHARQPDLVYVLRSSEEPDPFGLPGLGLITGGVPVGGGMHGGLNRLELNTVLICRAGDLTDGRVSSAPAGIIDIAPTVLDLLGVPPAASMRGRSLVRGHGAGRVTTFETGTAAFRQKLVRAEIGSLSVTLQGGAVA
ncbi:alkaline phosphatase family protein [Arenibaculum pallidiluteum]|uniref:alkaline phosphatase family protein n=1 Tax=Arenibaculum pallidiluteum TaxID=2812559 RepID=UPI001A96E2F8|nr:alkaline phosphatase family protein [Arenibaculum pallidiluteum]